MPYDTEFRKSTRRDDPYSSFRFLVRWEGRCVAGVSRVGGLARNAPVISHRAGGDPATPRLVPGQPEFAAITLGRGVTYDHEFEAWANTIWALQNGAMEGAGHQNVSLKDFRRDIGIEMYNAAGQKVLAYTIYKCWPSQFVALPGLDAEGDGVAIETLTLQHEGWERDTSIAEPTEGGFTLPTT